jgi:hypothetical protein
VCDLGVGGHWRQWLRAVDLCARECAVIGGFHVSRDLGAMAGFDGVAVASRVSGCGVPAIDLGDLATGRAMQQIHHSIAGLSLIRI